ncbi:MgtC/SapB family protein [Phyllobacterium sp. K27]
MDEIEIFRRIGLATAIGAMIGVERHWRERNQAAGSRTAGIRTYTLVGMLGGIAGLLEMLIDGLSGISGLIVVGFFIIFSSIFAMFQWRESIAENKFSVTSVIAAMLTYCLGTLAVLGSMAVASAGCVALVCILLSREFLHSFLRKVEWAELRSAVLLLALTFVVLPLLPKDPIGPFGGISLSRILLIVIALASISFCGYIALKLLGPTNGELAAGAIGGLVSSTAATIMNARRSTAGETIEPIAAGAISAGGVSLLRTITLILFLAPQLSTMLIPPLMTAAVIMLIYAITLAYRKPRTHQLSRFRNPFDIVEVIKMALILVGASLLTNAASQLFGNQGLITASILSGLVDVDAAMVSIVGLLPQISTENAGYALGLAVLSNIIAKAIYASVLGKMSFGLHVCLASISAVLAAALYVGVLAVW